jgi:hypothetical protein
VIFDVPDPAMASAIVGVAVSSGSVQNTDTPLYDGGDYRHSAKGEADLRRLQAARSTLISQGDRLPP